MKKVMHKHKRWGWILGCIVCMTLIFSCCIALKQKNELQAADTNTKPLFEVYDESGTLLGDSKGLKVDPYTMYRKSEAIYINIRSDSKKQVSCQSLATKYLKVTQPVNADATDPYTYRVDLTALDLTTDLKKGTGLTDKDGTAGLQVMVDGNTLTFHVKIGITINEYLKDAKGSTFTRVNDKDERRSLVMDYHKPGETGYDDGTVLEFGDGTQDDKLNLVVGKANDSEYTWKSANEDIVKVDSDKGRLIATGAGHTKLTVTSKNGGTGDTVDVYVRPEIRKDDKDGALLAGGGVATSSAILSNGDYIYASVDNTNNPLQTDKLVWVIAKQITGGTTETTELVCDSLGNKGKDADDAALVYIKDGKYQLNAKAGQYVVMFYVKDTYTSFKDAQNHIPGCAPISMKVAINAEFADINVTLPVGGNLDLSTAFNIPEATLNQYKFNISENTNDYKDPLRPQSPEGCCTIDNTKYQIVANKEGEAHFSAAFGDSNAVGVIPGVGVQQVKVNITVTDTFALNYSEKTMKVGETLQLHGVIGGDKDVSSDQFTWTTTDTTSTYISMETNQTDPKAATVTAKKNTKDPVYVYLSWTNAKGVTRTAACRIYVDDSVRSFSIIPSQVSMNVGDIKDLTTTLSGDQNVIWTSTDDNAVKVTPNAGNCSAKIEAKALPKDNGKVFIKAIINQQVQAQCEVTVNAPITQLSVGILNEKDKVTAYDAYQPALTDQYVFMQPIFKPTDATDKDFVWTSSDPTVAKLERSNTTGDTSNRLVLLKEGMTKITVKNMLSGLWATCDITVVTKPITSVTADVSSLDLVKGSSYTVTTKIAPKDATDTTLNWKVADSKIATVTIDKNDPLKAVITAKGVGKTAVTVSGGKSEPYTIMVNVRNKLNSISFGSSEKYIMLGDSVKVDVSFNPSTDVNKNLTWFSTDESIVTVTQDGVITGKGIGDAMIGCKAEDIKNSAGITMMVHVTDKFVAAKDFALIPQEGTAYMGTPFKIDTAFEPANATDQELTWSSSDEKIAKVDTNGVVTVLIPNEEVSITACYIDTPDGQPWIRSCKVKTKPAIVKAKSLQLSPASKNTMVGKSFQLKKVFTPANTTHTNVTYQSTDEHIATVNSKGVVTAKAPGDVMIEGQCYDGYHATCVVHVDGALNFKLSPSKRDLAIGHSIQISKKVSFKTSKKTPNKTATWKSSNPKVATVSSTGKVHAKKKGSCTITCTLTKYHQSAKCKLKIGKYYSKVSIKKSLYRIGTGQKYTLKPTVKTNGSKKPKLRFRSSNSRVASISSSSGKITAKAPGYATITVTTRDQAHATDRCRVWVVRRISKLRISPSYSVCYIGHTKMLHAYVTPSNATVTKLKWKSSNTKIATVNGGKVIGLKAGRVRITAYATDGSGKKASCYVRVKHSIPVTSVILAQKSLIMKKGDSTKLSYTKIPSNATDSVKFASDNHRVATVDKHGKVKAVGTGTCTVTMIFSSGVTSSVSVNVIALNKTYIRMRQYDTDTLAVYGTSNAVQWTSSNTRVATVTNGKVVGKGVGSAYIYAFVDGVKLGCTVVITSINASR